MLKAAAGAGRWGLSGKATKIEHYLQRAEELRAIADRLQTSDAKQLLRSIADHYDRMAAALGKKSAEK